MLCSLIFTTYLIYKTFKLQKHYFVIPIITTEENVKYEFKSLCNIRTTLNSIRVEVDNADLLLIKDNNYCARFVLC